MCKECGCGSDGNVMTKIFHVPGMMCSNCQNTVEGATLGLEGVLSSKVNLADKDAVISFEPNKISEEEISKAILKTGFDVESVRAYEHHHHGFIGAIKKLFK